MLSKKNFKFNASYLLMALLGVMILQNIWNQQNQVKKISYSEFDALIEANQISELWIGEKVIRGELQSPADGQKKYFVTNRVEDDLAERLRKTEIKYSRVIESTVLRDMLSWLLPAALFFAIWMFLIRRMTKGGGAFGGQLMSIGKSKAKVYMETDTKVTFADVAGIDEAKDELIEIVNFLKDPKSFGRLGARMPKGILLVGPPGTGKTLLAKAVAGEANVPFFSISGSEFVEMFVGVGAARVRDLFEQSRTKAPCIIFIDELDALGKARGSGPMSGGHDEKEQTLNQLLVELDGFDSSSGIVLLGATNRPEILDTALLRAGRFDRQVLVDRPDRTGRLAILKIHSRNIILDSKIELEKVAALTPGFSGADLENLANEAALAATRRQAENVTLEDFNVAIERIVAGLEKKNRLLNEEERKVVAFHEMGHALVAAATPGADPVHKVSIIPRGIGALGYTLQRPTEDRYLMTEVELSRKMNVLLGGRAAEKVVFEHLSTGAADDLSKATDIARSMVVRYGMDEDLGHMTYEQDRQTFLSGTGLPESRMYSESSAEKIDTAIRKRVADAFNIAQKILVTHRDVLEDGAAQLLTLEALSEEDLQVFFQRMNASTV